MLTVATVLKRGPEYTPSHVKALQAGVERHLKLPHRFVCLSDMVVECESIPLKHSWKGWFSKIELFRPGLFDGPVVYFDLDTIIVGSLDFLADVSRFAMLENFWRPDRVGSGMMAWDCDLSAIYETFAKFPATFMAEYSTPDKWGDQVFIRDHAPVQPDKLQEQYPGKIVSWKRHCERGVPKTASVVCFHGQPRPWHTPLWKAA